MTESAKYVMISDEQIKSDLSSNNVLFIVGQCGSGKTKLINRILRYLDTQSDCVYLFISHDLSNHTGDSSYGNISATEITNNVLPFIDGGIENFPETNLAVSTSDVSISQLSDFIFMMAGKCTQNNKTLYVVADDFAHFGDLEDMARRIPSFKLIVTGVVAEDVEKVRVLSQSLQRNFVTIQL